ncbi:MAG: T9SS type A sorting domain-containing protein, partial [Pedobacter sp.]
NSLVLTSTATRTARIGKQAAANTITGEVTVERYIPAGRKWRLLSVPTNTTQSFRKAWMENATNVSATVPAGYGTQITSHYAAWNSLGFDAYSAGGSSVKVYDPATALYVGIKSPDSLMKTTGGYMTFIRGDRSAGVSGNNVAATILRTKGSIYQATNTVTANRPSAVTIPATKLATVGNPFASAIDLRKITMANTTGTIYVWDANLTQGYGLGAFQTLIKIGGNYVTTPGNVVMNTIQSGQAFFVQATGTQGTVSFDENSKSDETAGTSVFRIPGVDQQLMVDLHLGTDAVLLDGVRAIYGDEYSNNVDYGDAPKLPNTSENVSIKRNNSLLAIERRADITNEDTLFLNLVGVRYATDYQWKISASNLDQTGRIGWLVDKFTNTQTQLDLTGPTDYTFAITTAAGSYAANRFMIVFKQSVVLPVTMTAVAATRNANKTVTLSWKSETEINIAKYTVEQSNDGRTFSAIGIAAPTNNNAGNASYSAIDANASAAINYYRINALSRDGKIQYSAIVKVDALNIPATGSITVYPNPVVDKTLNISFKNKSFGDYNLELISNNGQVVYKGVVTVGSANVMKTIRLNGSVAAGVYRLRAIGKDNAVFTT